MVRRLNDKRQREEDEEATREQVQTEMTYKMDAGVRVNEGLRKAVLARGH